MANDNKSFIYPGHRILAVSLDSILNWWLVVCLDCNIVLKQSAVDFMLEGIAEQHGQPVESLLKDLEKELGPPSEEDLAWARKAFQDLLEDHDDE